jgi:hypothetical protein
MEFGGSEDQAIANKSGSVRCGWWRSICTSIPGSLPHALQIAALRMTANQAGRKIPWRADDSVCIVRASKSVDAYRRFCWNQRNLRKGSMRLQNIGE